MSTTKSLSAVSVSDICQREVVSVSKDDTVSLALSLMVENRASALPVINAAGKCLGIISVSDIIGLIHDLDEEMSDPADPAPEWLVSKVTDHDLGRRRVEELMSTGIASVSAKADLRESAVTILRNKVHRLPVLDGDDRVIGIISTTDILEALVEHLPEAGND